MSSKDVDELVNKMIEKLKEKQGGGEQQNNNDPLHNATKNLKQYLKQFKEPHSFKVARGIIEALRNNQDFYVKYMKITEIIGLEDLLEVVSSVDSKNIKDILGGGRFEKADDGVTVAYSPPNSNRNIVLTPGAIFRVSGDFEKLRNLLPSYYSTFPRAFRAFFDTFDYDVYDSVTSSPLDYGVVAVFGKDMNEFEQIEAIMKGGSQWKRIKLTVKDPIDKDLAPEEFKDKKYYIARVDALYRGTRDDHLVIVPPEKITTYIGKLLRFYFDKSLDKSKVKVTDDAIDISEIDLPNVKKRKIKAKDRAEKIMKPHNEIVKAGLSDKGDKLVKIIPLRSKHSELSDVLLNLVALENKSDYDKVHVTRIMNWFPFETYQVHFRRLHLNIKVDGNFTKKILYRVSNFVIIPKDFPITNSEGEEVSAVEEVVDPLREEIISELEFTVHGKIGRSTVKAKYHSFEEGIFIDFDRPLSSHDRWTEHEIDYKVSDNRKSRLTVRTRGSVAWIPPKTIALAFGEKAREKLREAKKRENMLKSHRSLRNKNL